MKGRSHFPSSWESGRVGVYRMNLILLVSRRPRLRISAVRQGGTSMRDLSNRISKRAASLALAILMGAAAARKIVSPPGPTSTTKGETL